jgi:hypothetical protein
VRARAAGGRIPTRRRTVDPDARSPAAPRRPDAPLDLQDDAPVAEARRQGDPAQAAEPRVLPDQRGRARGRARGRGHGPEAGVRLVLRVLPRPRADAAARPDAPRDAPRRRGREGRPELRRPPDAVPLELPAAQRRHPVVAHGHAVPAGGRLRGGRRVPRGGAGARGDGALCRRRGRLLLLRRRRDLGGRVLGEPEHRLQPEAPRPLPRRGQRLRHLGPGGGADRGRQHLEARALLPRPARARGRRLRPPREPVGAQRGGRLVPLAAGAGPRPRPRHPPVLPLPLRRRDPLPLLLRARGGRPARPPRGVPAPARAGRLRQRRRPRGGAGGGRPRGLPRAAPRRWWTS